MEYMDHLRRIAAEEARQMRRIGQILGGQPDDVPEDPDEFDPSPRAQTVAASAIAPDRVEWLWPGRIPLGMLTLFSGDPKLGKSLVALSVLAAVSRGGPLPGTDPDSPVSAARGSAILLSAEDDPARTIVPRLLAAGADLDRIHILSSMLEPEFRGCSGRPAAHVPANLRMPTASADDLRAIERRAAALGDCRLIVFDPITAYLGGEADIRRTLNPLKEMAARLGATILLVTHLSKQGASGTNGKYRVRGRIDYVGVCRSNTLFLADPDDPTGRRRLMLDNGGNLGATQPGLAYVVQDAGDAARVDWLPETIDLDADGALARTARINRSGTTSRLGRRQACEEWLRGYLADGPKPVKECEQAAMAAGFNRGLLERARGALAIRGIRAGFGKGASYHLCLPGTDDDPAEHPENTAGAHAPHFARCVPRVEHVEHVEHERPNGTGPDADRGPAISWDRLADAAG